MREEKFDIPTIPFDELLEKLPSVISRALVIRCAPEKPVRRAVDGLRKWKVDIEISVLCHEGREIESCGNIIYPDKGFFHLEKLDLEVLRKRHFNLVVVPYSTNRRLSPYYHNVDRIAGAMEGAEIIILYADGSALRADREFVEFKLRTVVEPYLARKKEALEEIIAFTGEELGAVEEKCDLAGLSAISQWIDTQPSNEEEVLRYYRENDFYIYELMKTEYSGDRDSLVEAVLDEIGPGQRVLDYGGGCGTFSIPLAQAQAEVTHLDLEGPLLDFVRFRFKRRGLPVKIIAAGAGLPLIETYDAIVSIYVLEHLSNPEEVLSHMAEHVKPGGNLLVAVDFEESTVKDSPLPLHLSNLSRGRYEELTQELGLKRLKSKGELDIFQC